MPMLPSVPPEHRKFYLGAMALGAFTVIVIAWMFTQPAGLSFEALATGSGGGIFSILATIVVGNVREHRHKASQPAPAPAPPSEVKIPKVD